MVPYGYRIVDGQAVPDPVDAMNLRMMYSLYLKGFTIDDAAHDASDVQSSPGGNGVSVETTSRGRKSK